MTGRPADPLRFDPAPRVPFGELRALWFQITGTLCNLACRHCFNASGPRDPWLRSLDASVVRRYVAQAATLGVRELYFTGGEPFLHPELLSLLEEALAVAPTTVLTNGTLIDDATADRLVETSGRSPYSLEVRISLDAATAEANDALRGRGSFARALAAIQRLSARGLPPIVTATDILVRPGEPPLYDRLRAMLLAAGVTRPRIKILPVLPAGRCEGRRAARFLRAEDLDGFDARRLECSGSRAIAAGGIYACPILAGLPGARLAAEGLAEALGPTTLYHSACYTCYETGLTCRNF